MLETSMTSATEISPVYERGKKTLIRDRNAQKSPGETNLQMHLEKLNESEEIQNKTTPTTEEDPNVITVTHKNGYTDLIKTEQIENTNENTNNEPSTPKSSRIKTVNSILRFGNPITQ